MLLRRAAAVAALVALLAACSSSSGTAAAPTTPATTRDTSAPLGAVARPAPPSGSAYVDPDGTYTMTVAAGWTERSGTLVKEIEAWIVGPGANGFTPNVNVLTQDAAGMDLDGYLAFTLAHMGVYTVVAHDVTTGAGGQRLGRIEYAGTPSGSTRALHYLAMFDVRHEQAVVATLTTEEAGFAALRPTVEPYLLTLLGT